MRICSVFPKCHITSHFFLSFSWITLFNQGRQWLPKTEGQAIMRHATAARWRLLFCQNLLELANSTPSPLLTSLFNSQLKPSRANVDHLWSLFPNHGFLLTFFHFEFLVQLCPNPSPYNQSPFKIGVSQFTFKCKYLQRF